MALNIGLLEQSFDVVAPKGDELVDVFYRNLFADYPQVLPLFENVEMSQQKKKLLTSLKLVVANLRDPLTLLPGIAVSAGWPSNSAKTPTSSIHPLM